MSSTTSYNIKNYIYENKTAVKTFTILAIVMALLMIMFVYMGSRNPVSENILPPLPVKPPEYGYGPFGYGLYRSPIN